MRDSDSPSQTGSARLRLAEPHLAAAGAAASPEAAEPAERGSTAPLIAGHFATDLYPGFMPGLWPEVGRKLGLTEVATSTFPAISSFMMILQPFLGLWADRLGARRRFIVTGLVLAACLYPVLVLMPSCALVVACLVPAAFGVAAFHPVGAGAARRGGAAALSVFVGIGTAGYVLGQYAGPKVVEKWGPEWLPLFAVLGLAVAAWIQLTERPGSRPPPPSLAVLWSDLRARWRPVAVLWLLVAVRAYAIMSCVILIPFFLRDRGLGPVLRARPGMLIILANAAGGLAAAWLMRRLGPRLAILLSFLVGMPVLAAAPYAASLGSGAPGAWDAAGYALALLGGAVTGSTVPVNIWMGQRLLPRSAALASGLTIGFGWSVGGMLVPLTALLGRAVGSTAHAVAGVTLAATAAGFLALLLPRFEPAPEAAGG